MTFQRVTKDGVSTFEPVSGWRWWPHFGANETRLMYPRVPSLECFRRLADNLQAAIAAFGASLATAGQAMAAWAESWNNAEGGR